MAEVIMTIRNITKLFPGVRALHDVSFDIHAGEVRGLVGENGAGKSTLIKTIMRAHKQDSGTVCYNYQNREVTLSSPLEAREKGVVAYYQDVAAAMELSVTENYFMGKLLIKNGVVNWPGMHRITKQKLEEFGMPDIDPRAKMKTLSLAKRAMVVISKLVSENPKMIIFDEPTASLTAEDSAILFAAIQRLKESGAGILYISHRLEEVLALCDNVTVLKDGKCVGTYPTEGLDEEPLIQLMVGRDVGDIYNIRRAPQGEVALQVDNLCRKNVFEKIGFSLKQGEVLGLFGLIGSGRTEIVRALFGADPIDSGTITMNGRTFHRMAPLTALKNGMGLATEDRRQQGLATELSVQTNINAASYDLISSVGIVNTPKERRTAEEMTQKLRIKTPSIHQLLKNLSGGNQQKVVIAKLLCRNPNVLVFDEPTVGIDVGAKAEIFSLIEDLTHQGKAVIVISSYMPELMGLSDRILTICQGQITGEFLRGQVKEEELLRAASKT